MERGALRCVPLGMVYMNNDCQSRVAFIRLKANKSYERKQEQIRLAHDIVAKNLLVTVKSELLLKFGEIQILLNSIPNLDQKNILTDPEFELILNSLNLEKLN